ncbi:cytoglobin-like [Anneissia japonica]|uniref:cytoglobin-like n=1 Tax=Anneissia japonica TaxID=1529436 RepID=UPI0014259869|nr:cytoglobin-like [Anneissia japonica]XP_033122092.1 cytoglobin-like [Anneissia japonica]
MGGEQSSLSKVWSAVSWWLPGWEDDLEKDKIGLTSRQRKSVVQMWTEVNKNKIYIGCQIFVKLFIKYPETRQMFPSLRKLTFDETFAKSPKLRAHSGRFMGLLSTCIENINEPEMFEQLLIGLATSHHRFKVKTTDFQALGPLIDDAFEESLGGEFSKERRIAWNIFAEYMFNIINTELLAIESQHEEM